MHRSTVHRSVGLVEKQQNEKQHFERIKQQKNNVTNGKYLLKIEQQKKKNKKMKIYITNSDFDDEKKK